MNDDVRNKREAILRSIASGRLCLFFPGGLKGKDQYRFMSGAKPAVPRFIIDDAVDAGILAVAEYNEAGAGAKRVTITENGKAELRL